MCILSLVQRSKIINDCPRCFSAYLFRLKSKTCVDTIDRFSYIKPALHTTRGRPTNCGKAVSMRDSYSSCVDTNYQTSLYYLSQVLSNQANHSNDPASDAEIL